MTQNQGALFATNIWVSGRTLGSPSRKMDVVAGLILTDNDRASNLLTIGEPQTRQKLRWEPGDDS